jgi:hydroxyacylglutathione hydrolase
VHPVELVEILEMGDAGAQILDVRDATEYAKGHMVGSINIGLGGQYATWAGTVLDSTRPIMIIAEPDREQEAALRLGRIGFDHVRGYLRDGMGALAERQDLVRSTEKVSALMLAEELASQDPPLVLDIRAPREWSVKHLRGSINLPLTQLQERIEEVPRNRRIAVHCAGGYRSSIAVSILSKHGITNLIELAGGITAWEAANFEMVTD